MVKFSLIKSMLLAALIAAPGTLWACDAAGKQTHIGNITAIDTSTKSFTIRDAQTQSLITFAANTEILRSLKDSSGSIMVNYEEAEDGNLNAVGVTF